MAAEATMLARAWGAPDPPIPPCCSLSHQFAPDLYKAWPIGCASVYTPGCLRRRSTTDKLS